MRGLAQGFLIMAFSVMLSLTGCRVDPDTGGPPFRASAQLLATPRPTVILALPLASVTPGPTSGPRPTPTVGSGLVRVEISDNFFDPQVITVTVGSMIDWRHLGITTHDVTAVDRSWGGSLIMGGNTWQQRFERTGEFDYYCTIHSSGMRGRVVVVNSRP
jgi:plastocyanin